MAMLIKGGVLVTPWGREAADIYIENETIKAIGTNLEDFTEENVETVDATGYYVLPGVIDAHVQLEGKYKQTVMTDDFNTGTKAAACGGITTIIDFAVQKQGGYSALEALRHRKAQADPKVCVDYSLHAGITDPTENTLHELSQIMSEGVVSFKCYMTYKNRGRMVDEAGLFKVMAEVSRHNGVVEVHAENNNLVEYMTEKLVNEGYTTSSHFPASRTDIAEQVAVSAAILISRDTGCDLYVHHVTSGKVVDLIKAAQQQGIRVYGETCPQYLLLDSSVYRGANGARFIMNPPIRGREDRKRLWEALAQGVLHTVGTDHCSYTIEQKDRYKDTFYEVPAGVPGLETLFSTVYSYGVCEKKISLERLTEVLSLNPAKIFGLYPKKGIIKVGSDADLVLFNPNGSHKIKAENLHMSTDFNPFEDMEAQGKIHMTILRGRVICKDGEFAGSLGYGRFINAVRGVSK